MVRITLRTKFLSGLACLSAVTLLMIFTSLRAIHTLEAELNQVVYSGAERVQRIDAVANNLVGLTGLQKDQLLRSILNDASGVEVTRKAVAENEATIDRLFSELDPLLESQSDRELASELRRKAAGAREVSEQIEQLIARQQMADALRLVSEKLMPEYEQLLKSARGFSDDQRRRETETVRTALNAAENSRWLAFSFLSFTALAVVVLSLLFRRMLKELTSMATDVAHGAHQVAIAAEQVNSVSHSLAHGASEQAASLEETSASTEEINSMVHHNADNSQEAARLTGLAEKLLFEANSKLEQMLSSMKDISDSSEKISKIIRVIDEIAFQTNMLSLNAAVEAARAGEAGMGFAVVADEVRNLAQRCSQAARDTSTLIEESIDHARVGKIRVDEVASAMRQVTENSSVIGRLSRDVSTSSSEQARGIEQISKAIAQIQMVTQKNAASAEEGASAGAEMTKEAQHLQAAVTHLRGLLGIARASWSRVQSRDEYRAAPAGI